MGDRSIPAKDVVRLAGELNKKGLAPDSAKAVALEALIRRNLMVLEAEDRGMEKDDRRQRMWKKLDGDLLREALEKDLTKDVVVTDEELADLIERSTRRVVTREIAFADSATAARVSAEIRAGKLDFAAAAKQYSQDPEAATTGGQSLPMSELGLALGPLQPLLDSPPGEIYGPFRFRQLYYLARLESRTPVEGEIWDADNLRPRVLDHHKQAVLTAFLEQMKLKYHYWFNAPASHEIADAVRRVMIANDARAAKIAEAGGVPPDGASEVILAEPTPGRDGWGVSDSLRAKHIYVHDQGGRTVAVYLDRMAKVPIDFVAQNINPSKIEQYCEDFFKDDVYPLEAKARGLDVKIKYEQTRKNRYEEFLVDELYREQIFEKIKPDINTLEAYWRENQAKFPPRPVIVGSTICFATAAEAERAKLRIDQGLSFDDLAKEIEAAPPPKDGSAAPQVTRELRASTQETWLYARIGGAKVGEVYVAPDPEDRQCLLRLDRREPGTPDFTSSYEQVLNHYRYQHDEEPFRRFCDEIKTRHPVVIHREVLDAVRLPG